MNDDQNIKNTNTEIDLLELVRQLWSKRWFILKVTGIALVIGLIVAISIPKEYTCIVKMAPEGAKTSLTSNMSDLAAIAGINIGAENVDGISLTLYPDVVKSTPFMTELINIKISGKGIKSGMTLYNYMDKGLRKPWWSKILISPFKLINIINHSSNKQIGEKINPYNLTVKQKGNFQKLNERVFVTIDKKTGIISAGVTMQDPVIATIVADSLVNNLERFVIEYRTNKAKQDFIFASKMFSEARQNYYDAQKSYARYMDENKNLVLESVLIEQDRLKNEQMLTYNVYSTLAEKVELARLKVQEQTPVATIIEPASIPVNKSNVSGLTLLLCFGFIGSVIGIFQVLFQTYKKVRIIR